MPIRTVLEKGVRRQQILDAAVRVFARSGYKNSGISEIIAEAGVARGTFYLYFESKLDVFNAILDLYLQGLKALVSRETTRDYSPLKIRSAIRESLMDSLRYYKDNRDLAAVVLREAMAIDPAFEEKCMEIVGGMHRHWSEAVQRLQKLGFVRADLDPEFLNICFTGMFIQIVLRCIIPNPDADLEKIADQWIEFTQRGVVSRLFAA